MRRSHGMPGFRLLAAATALAALAACGNESDNSAAPSLSTTEEEDFSIEAFGTVAVTRARALSIEFPALIETIHVSEGERVTSGSVLITLDARSYENQQAALRSKIEIARLRLDQIRDDYEKSETSTSSEFRTLENSIASAQQEIDQLIGEYEDLRHKITTGEDPEVRKLEVDLEQGKKELQAAEDELNLRNELSKDGSILERDLERERNAVEALRSKTVNLELTIESTKNRQRQELNRLQLAITQKTIGAENMKIQLDLLAGPEATNLEIQKRQIAAYEQELGQLMSRSQFPYIDGNRIVSDVENGIVREIKGTEGDVVATGVALIEILDLDSLVVNARVPEEFVKDIEPASIALIKPLADTDREYTGRVSRISGMAVSRNGETVVDVTLEILDHDGFLIPNFNVDIEFSPKESEGSETTETEAN